MKKTTVIFIVILIAILVIALRDSFTINVGPENTDGVVGANDSTEDISGLETIESNEGPVSVAVTPLDLETASPSWSFDVTLNTHSEEIGEDLVAVSELLDDAGKIYKPTLWEGSPPGGHHRSGILKFNSISPRPESLELKINNVGGISVRSFKWDL